MVWDTQNIQYDYNLPVRLSVVTVEWIAMSIGAVFGALQRILEGVGSTGARVTFSVLLVVVAIAIGFVAAPYTVERIANSIRRWLEAREIDAQVEAAEEQLDELGVSFPTVAVVRILQTGIIIGAGLALLLLWGLAGAAATVVAFLALTIPYLLRVTVTVGLLVGAYVGTDVLESRLESYAANSARLNRHQEGIVFRVLQVVLFVAVALAALSLWKVNLGGLLVGAGFLGIVVGMAARQTLGALIAGFVLMFSRPFELGDWVQIGENEGIVTNITVINTRLRNFDDETVVIPNDQVSNSTVINRTDRDRLRIRVDVGIDYDANIDVAAALAADAIEDLDRILSVPKPQAVPTAFGDSAVILELRYWIEKPSSRRRWQTRAAVIRAVKDAFDDAGIKIPFPQRELTGRQETGGLRVDDT